MQTRASSGGVADSRRRRAWLRRNDRSLGVVLAEREDAPAGTARRRAGWGVVRRRAARLLRRRRRRRGTRRGADVLLDAGQAGRQPRGQPGRQRWLRELQLVVAPALSTFRRLVLAALPHGRIPDLGEGGQAPRLQSQRLAGGGRAEVGGGAGGRAARGGWREHRDAADAPGALDGVGERGEAVLAEQRLAQPAVHGVDGRVEVRQGEEGDHELPLRLLEEAVLRGAEVEVARARACLAAGQALDMRPGQRPVALRVEVRGQRPEAVVWPRDAALLRGAPDPHPGARGQPTRDALGLALRGRALVVVELGLEPVDAIAVEPARDRHVLRVTLGRPPPEGNAVELTHFGVVGVLWLFQVDGAAPAIAFVDHQDSTVARTPDAPAHKAAMPRGVLVAGLRRPPPETLVRVLALGAEAQAQVQLRLPHDPLLAAPGEHQDLVEAPGDRLPEDLHLHLGAVGSQAQLERQHQVGRDGPRGLRGRLREVGVARLVLVAAPRGLAGHLVAAHDQLAELQVHVLRRARPQELQDQEPVHAAQAAVAGGHELRQEVLGPLVPRKALRRSGRSEADHLE
eukprot:CAMPEP_0204544500 /NCGR_PEP_ID=MMETSP0661-20131031/20562_1 /ASSEMBLY_ACC=CAM_ASM_000606 /TAXON_ID=109239 /ORGANISM="Alexandrium margalefi, Strain AMGDE01CS-322" /LENGTH=569 /DNA_ID=CAMNT_0051551271 /DNA_START=303 /DNA_END=2009 /DNA_ORIENTATION=-